MSCTREAISSGKNIQIGNFTIVAGEIRNYELPPSRAAIKRRRNQVMCGRVAFWERSFTSGNALLRPQNRAVVAFSNY